MKNETCLTLCIILLVFYGSSLCIPLGAATSDKWSKTYGGIGIDVFVSVVHTSDGGYALAGYTNSSGAGGEDMWFVKTDSSGNMQWNQTFGGPSDDSAMQVIQTADGGYALAGATSGGSLLVKTDSSGNMQWNQTYKITSQVSLVRASDGGYILAGTDTEHGAPFLIKTDSSGNMEWNQTYSANLGAWVSYVFQTADGGYALLGQTYTGTVGSFSYVPWFAKTNSSGNMEWNQAYEQAGYGVLLSMVGTSDGGYALAGSKSFGAGNNAWLVKTNSSGDMQWNQTYGGMVDENANVILQTSDGYVLEGYTNSTGDMYKGPRDALLLKTDFSGSLLWNRTYGGSGNDVVFSMVQASDGGYALAGFTNSNGAGRIDGLLIKTDAQGKTNMISTNALPQSDLVYILAGIAIIIIIVAATIVLRRRRKAPPSQRPPTPSPPPPPQS